MSSLHRRQSDGDRRAARESRAPGRAPRTRNRGRDPDCCCLPFGNATAGTHWRPAPDCACWKRRLRTHRRSRSPTWTLHSPRSQPRRDAAQTRSSRETDGAVRTSDRRRAALAHAAARRRTPPGRARRRARRGSRRGGQVPAAGVRRAAMLAGDLGDVAQAVHDRRRVDALAAVRVRFQPLQPMLADSRRRDATRSRELGARRIRMEARRRAHPGPQGRRRSARLLARICNDVTAAVPEVVEAVRALPAERARSSTAR